MTKKDLLKYSKEELAMFIFQNNFLYDLEYGMHYVHTQYLLDKDKNLTEEEHKKEMKLLEELKIMPHRTIEEKDKWLKAWEKYKQLCDRNIIAYNKRQGEINRLLDL